MKQLTRGRFVDEFREARSLTHERPFRSLSFRVVFSHRVARELCCSMMASDCCAIVSSTRPQLVAQWIGAKSQQHIVDRFVRIKCLGFCAARLFNRLLSLEFRGPNEELLRGLLFPSFYNVLYSFRGKVRLVAWLYTSRLKRGLVPKVSSNEKIQRLYLC